MRQLFKLLFCHNPKANNLFNRQSDILIRLMFNCTETFHYSKQNQKVRILKWNVTPRIWASSRMLFFLKHIVVPDLKFFTRLPSRPRREEIEQKIQRGHHLNWEKVDEHDTI